ncbi:MAG: hypothetical protein ACTSPY_04705 [Candidatus Helarchaeota archaeon]
MAVDDEFYKKFIKMLQELMTPEVQKKIQEFIRENPDFLKKMPFMNVNAPDLQEFFNFLNKNPNVKISIGSFPGFGFPITNNPQKSQGKTRSEADNEEICEPSCYWIDDEYHIIFNHPENNLKFKTAVHRKDKSKMMLIILNPDGKLLKKIELPSTINYKSIHRDFNNGIYDITYKKNE